MLASYLEESHWVVDTVEYARNPELYSHAFAGDERFETENAIYVPILNRESLVGIIRIDRPAGQFL